MFILDEKDNKKTADIRIIGVGGGGSNALETMIKEGIQGAGFIAVNTDHQALDKSSAGVKVQLGAKLTKGLGAGANPETGRRAAVESYEEIVKVLKGADMVFITAGMGGGTGTGGAPLVAQAAEDLDLLTVGIVTKPFLFEGHKRMKQAEQGIREMRSHVDTLIVIPNERLLSISKESAPLLETFKMTDNVLLQAVKGIADLVSVPGLINLDFADIKTVMKNKGPAIMGRGVAEGQDRAKKAIISAISSPLLDGMSIKGATGMIVNLTASSSLSLSEVRVASAALTKLTDHSADVIVGTVIDETMKDKLSVTVIATGFSNRELKNIDPDFLFEEENSTQAKDLKKTVLEKKKPESLFPPRSLDFKEDSVNQEAGNSATCDKDTANQEASNSARLDEDTANQEAKGLDKSCEDSASQEASNSAICEEDTANQEAGSSAMAGESSVNQEASSLDMLDEDTANQEAKDSGRLDEDSVNQEASDSAMCDEDTASQEAGDSARCKDTANQEVSNSGRLKEDTASQEASNSSNKDSASQEMSDPAMSPLIKEQSCQTRSKDQQNAQKKLSSKDILLSKIKEYEQRKHTSSAKPEDQIKMNWQESQLEEEPSSPFEPSIDFSDKDMI